jgi:DNA-binding MarR family transcriptional regulator
VDDSGSSDPIDAIVVDLRRVRPDLDSGALQITGRLLRLAQFVASRREAVLAPFGLSVADFDMLASLRRRAGSGPVNVRDLLQWLMLSSGGMTKRLDRLEAVGLIERRRDPTDRRGVLIELTAAGLDVIENALTEVLASERQLVTTAIDSAETRRSIEDGLRRLLLMDDQD